MRKSGQMGLRCHEAEAAKSGVEQVVEQVEEQVEEQAGRSQ